MSDTLQFDLVSPERKLASLAASSVEIPGADGDFTAMPDHAPFLTTLRPGILKVMADGSETNYVVTGGFVEVSGTSATVLAESAVLSSDVTAEMVADMVSAAEEGAVGLEGADKDLADKRIADTRALADAISV